MTNDYLVHYGVLGMHWGVRRYQPYSVVPRGSGEGGKEIGLAAKQKRNFKDIKKSYNKDKDPSRPYRMNDDTKKSIDNKIKDSGLLNSDDFKKDLKEAKVLKEKYKKMRSDTIDYTDSKEFKERNKEAYKETYDYFEKHEPEYLKEIIERNGDSKNDLDRFHDFRKLYEGNWDSDSQFSYEEWLKTPEGKKREMSDKAYGEYRKQLSKIGKRVSSTIVGKYGDKPLNGFELETYDDLIEQYVSDVIYEKYKV